MTHFMKVRPDNPPIQRTALRAAVDRHRVRQWSVHVLSEAVHVLVHDLKGPMSDAGRRTTRRLSSGAAVCVWENKAKYEYVYVYVYGEAPRPNKPLHLTAASGRR